MPTPIIYIFQRQSIKVSTEREAAIVKNRYIPKILLQI